VTRYSPLASPRATIEALTEWGIATRKSLGQHFLVDDGVVGKILRLAEVAPGDEVLEVGPGIGTLTEALLLTGARVTAIEKDDKLLKVIANISQRYPDTFRYLHADALDVSPQTISPQMLGRAQTASETSPFRLVANLPYAVAATLVLDYFLKFPHLSSATVMVQKEVAARMFAQPGTKDYGAYTVKLGLLAQPQAHFNVSRASFLPPPRVDSTVIRLDRRSSQPDAQMLKASFTVIEAAFAERRKTIRNSMRSYFSAHNLDPAQIDPLLAAAALPPTTRGETLTLEDYKKLGDLWRPGSLVGEGKGQRPHRTSGR
jgi:16S rRNA (adenine1518-N6/adenine1519-N6)-dimethyltransferase